MEKMHLRGDTNRKKQICKSGKRIEETVTRTGPSDSDDCIVNESNVPTIAERLAEKIEMQ
jgi:hypothetical protein